MHERHCLSLLPAIPYVTGVPVSGVYVRNNVPPAVEDIIACEKLRRAQVIPRRTHCDIVCNVTYQMYWN